jgi:crotonobetaine/carnitine-CoA ligase
MLTFPPFTPHFAMQDWVLSRVLEHQARVRGSRPFLRWTDAAKALTFEEVNRTVNRLAHGLRRLGVQHGDRVVLYLPNCLEYVLSWFALNKLGAVEVPIGEANRGAFLQHQLKSSDASIAIVDAALIGRLVDLEHAVEQLQHIVLWQREGAEPAAVPRFQRWRTSPFACLYSEEAGDPGVEVKYTDLASVLFTSGTTGPSKGVMMPHSQLYFFAEQDAQLTRLAEDDTYMIAFPLSHGNAQFCAVYPCLIAGASCVLYERFSASDFVERLHRSGATVTNLLGVTMSFVHKQPPSPRDRGHRLRRIYAAPTAHSLVPAYKERFGVQEFVEGFGQTEISLPIVTPPDRPCPSGASGVLVDQWFDARIVDPETDEELPLGQVGELLVRPKQPGIVSRGYLGMPEKTVETWRNLWWHTGDALRRDAEGWFHFVDRVKDSLRCRGENVSSFELEAAVLQHPAIAECAVVGIRSGVEAGEDEVKACIVLKPGAPFSFAELAAWCQERMPKHAVPRYLEVYEQLPKTASEKVQKVKLRNDGITPKTWDRLGTVVSPQAT